jgi:hypothetical protein
MPRERSDISALKLASSPSNLRKALKLRTVKPGEVPSKREELEQLFDAVKNEYEIAADDVRVRGQVLTELRYTPKGKEYEVEKVNPYFRTMRALMQQMTTLAKMLSKLDAPKPSDVAIPGSAADRFPELFQGRN